jgi:pimeloyl-ACP methyl ester carboxylesterase
VDAREVTRRDVILAHGVRVAEHTTTIDHVPVFYRNAEEAGSSGASPIVYLHEALTSSDDVVPLLARTGGVAPDMIGFGRSGKGGHLDYTPQGLVDFVQRFLDHVGLERVRLVGHGWGGALGLILAEQRPELVERLVVIDPVPLLEGFVWPRPVRLWRKPVIGELVMGSTPRWFLSRELRRASPKAWTADRLAAVWHQFDQGTQRALLRLHRAADETQLADLGSRLERLGAPVQIIWGEADPWFAPRFADAYAARLPHAEVEHVAGAGHWPWLDEPRAGEVVVDFLTRS